MTRSGWPRHLSKTRNFRRPQATTLGASLGLDAIAIWSASPTPEYVWVGRGTHDPTRHAHACSQARAYLLPCYWRSSLWAASECYKGRARRRALMSSALWYNKRCRWGSFGGFRAVWDVRHSVRSASLRNVQALQSLSPSVIKKVTRSRCGVADPKILSRRKEWQLAISGLILQQIHSWITALVHLYNIQSTFTLRVRSKMFCSYVRVVKYTGLRKWPLRFLTNFKAIKW